MKTKRQQLGAPTREALCASIITSIAGRREYKSKQIVVNLKRTRMNEQRREESLGVLLQHGLEVANGGPGKTEMFDAQWLVRNLLRAGLECLITTGFIGSNYLNQQRDPRMPGFRFRASRD